MGYSTRIVQALAKNSGRRFSAHDYGRTGMYRLICSTGHGENSDTTELKAPKMPEEWECCGNGCDDCVWDSYFRENKAYLQKKQEQLRRSQDDTDTKR